MKSLKRNCQPIQYALFEGKYDLTEESADAWETGEHGVLYSAPAELKDCTISPARGTVLTELFGNLDSYDQVLITHDMTCPIDEQSILFIGIPPTSDPATGAYMYNYIVKRVARSLNNIAYAIRKVEVGAWTDNVYAIDSRSLFAARNGRRARAWVSE